MKTKKNQKKLPDFDKMTYEEEAHWWETHDLEEYKDEFVESGPFQVEPSALNAPKELKELSKKLVALNLEDAIRVRLTVKDKQKLKMISNQMGIGMATLVRMWILEKLRTKNYQIQAA